MFDASRGRAVHAQAHHRRAARARRRLDRDRRQRDGPRHADGSCGEARWSLRFRSDEPELRHLSPAWLYRAPLPRTKLTSPAPAASFDGVLELTGRGAIDCDGWPGMVGHNWGSEHAERWIWLHGLAFAEEPERVAGRRARPAEARPGG